MVSLTPEMAGNTIVIMGIVYVITFIYSIYMAYVGWKQAKVNKWMDDLIAATRNIEDLLKALIKIKSKNIEVSPR